MPNFVVGEVGLYLASAQTAFIAFVVAFVLFLLSYNLGWKGKAGPVLRRKIDDLVEKIGFGVLVVMTVEVVIVAAVAVLPLVVIALFCLAVEVCRRRMVATPGSVV